MKKTKQNEQITTKKTKVESEQQVAKRETRFKDGVLTEITVHFQWADHIETRKLFVLDNLTLLELKEHLISEIGHNIKIRIHDEAKIPGHFKLKQFNKNMKKIFTATILYGVPSERKLKFDRRPKEIVWLSAENILYSTGDYPNVFNFDQWKRLHNNVFSEIMLFLFPCERAHIVTDYALLWGNNVYYFFPETNKSKSRVTRVSFNEIRDIAQFQGINSGAEYAKDRIVVCCLHQIALLNIAKTKKYTAEWSISLSQFQPAHPLWKYATKQSGKAKNTNTLTHSFACLCSNEYEQVAVAFPGLIYFFSAADGTEIESKEIAYTRMCPFQNWGVACVTNHRTVQILSAAKLFANHEFVILFEWDPFQNLLPPDSTESISLWTDPRLAPDFICCSVFNISRAFSFDGRCCQTFDVGAIRINQQKEIVVGFTPFSDAYVFPLVPHRREALTLLLLIRHLVPTCPLHKTLFPLDLFKVICTLSFFIFPKYSSLTK